MAYAHVLTDDEGRELLRIARATIREFADSGRIPPGKPHRASLVAPALVAVRLSRAGGERGHAAATEERPLYRAIQEMVVAAARTVEAFDEELAEELAIAVEVTTAAGPLQLAESPRAT